MKKAMAFAAAVVFHFAAAAHGGLAEQSCRAVSQLRAKCDLQPVICRADPLLQEILEKEMLPEKAAFRSSRRHPEVKFNLWVGFTSAVPMKLTEVVGQDRKHRLKTVPCGSGSITTTMKDSIAAWAAAEELYPTAVQQRSGLFDRLPGVFGMAAAEFKDNKGQVIRVLLTRRKS